MALPFNPHKLLKKELIDLFTKRCRHNHLLVEHPNCIKEVINSGEKVAIFDIETKGDLNDAGTVGCTLLCYVFKDYHSDTYKYRVITKKELLSDTYDRNIVKECIEDLKSYDKIIGFYSTNFDIPVIRTKSLIYGLDFPEWNFIQHADVYYMAKGKLKLRRKSMDNISGELGIVGKTHLEKKIWDRAGRLGDPEALKYVLDHCIADTQVTEVLYDRLRKFSRESKKSI